AAPAPGTEHPTGHCAGLATADRRPCSSSSRGPPTTCWRSPAPAPAKPPSRRGLVDPHVVAAGGGGEPDDPSDPSDPNVVVLLDEDGSMHRRYGLTGPGCYLLRPDGHARF